MDRIFGTLIICGIALISFSTFSSVYVAYKIYPEIGMVVKSQCKNPTPSWNGKVMGIQVCGAGISTRQSFFIYLFEPSLGLEEWI